MDESSETIPSNVGRLRTFIHQMRFEPTMEIKIKSVEILPLVKYDMEALRLARLFDKFVPNHNGAEIALAQVLCMMIMNITVSTTLLHRMED
ncbi:MAG TPA: hypothetical protein DDY14_02160 [Chromatiaceae bacterium]|nr:hypothetical protein [Chromatiaceae bacterium]